MWCDVMWCDVMWCDVIWYDMIWYYLYITYSNLYIYIYIYVYICCNLISSCFIKHVVWRLKCSHVRSSLLRSSPRGHGLSGGLRRNDSCGPTYSIAFLRVQFGHLRFVAVCSMFRLLGVYLCSACAVNLFVMGFPRPKMPWKALPRPATEGEVRWLWAVWVRSNPNFHWQCDQCAILDWK